MFDKNDINIPFPQVVVHSAKPTRKKAVRVVDTKKAKNFVSKQRKRTKGTDDTEN